MESGASQARVGDVGPRRLRSSRGMASKREPVYPTAMYAPGWEDRFLKALLEGCELNLSDLVVRDEEGRVRLMMGLLVTVYFQGQLTRSMRQAVTDVAADYFLRTGSQARWKSRLNPDDPCDWSSGEIPQLWLPDNPDGETWCFDFHGGDCESEATCAFRIDGYGSPIDDTGGLGFVHMSFPYGWFGEELGGLHDYVLKVCQRIRPLSGYAGLGVLEFHEKLRGDPYLPVVRALAERHPGLEIENRTGHTTWLHTGIKGVNWLTILGDKWVRGMGGLDSLRAALDASIGVSPYDGGVVLQAGPKPEVGHTGLRVWPEHYVKLAAALKKVQAKRYALFHVNGGPGSMNAEASGEWLIRFDGR